MVTSKQGYKKECHRPACLSVAFTKASGITTMCSHVWKWTRDNTAHLTVGNEIWTMCGSRIKQWNAFMAKLLQLIMKIKLQDKVTNIAAVKQVIISYMEDLLFRNIIRRTGLSEDDNWPPVEPSSLIAAIARTKQP